MATSANYMGNIPPVAAATTIEAVAPIAAIPGKPSYMPFGFSPEQYAKELAALEAERQTANWQGAALARKGFKL